MQNNRCFNCKWYAGKLKCLAFSKQIPNEILTGNENHNKPLKNQDNNIVFEKI
tara:strand:- start:451 stop:609 length:159 start_codon:yes stop_codon:yes gene_type:complete